VRLETLRVFRDVVRERNFSRAARRHYLTQSAVSQQIRALEKHFGVRLLARRGGAWEPTPAGRALYAGAGRILTALERLRADLRRRAAAPQGALRVLASWTVGLYELPRALRLFLKRHADVALGVDFAPSPEILARLRQDACDVGVMAYPRPGPGLRLVPLGRDRLVLACGPRAPFGGRRSIRLEELDGAPFIAFHRSLPTRRHTDALLRDAGIAPRIVRSYANVEMVKSAVEADLGAAFLPRALVRRDPALRAVHIPGFLFERPIAAAVREGRADDPLIAAFLRSLRRCFSSNTSGGGPYQS
jgi:DNA-binding transcriptional LysR family regulator